MVLYGHNLRQFTILLILLILFLSILNISAIEDKSIKRYSDELNENNNYNIRNDDFLNSFSIDCRYENIEFNDIFFNGIRYTQISFPNCILTSEPGTPMLPYDIRTIGIPTGANISYDLSIKKYKIKNDIDIYPCPKPIEQLPGIQIGCNENPFRFYENESIYSKTDFYPGSLIDITDRGFLRSQEIIRLKIFPLQFNPKTRQLKVYHHIKINFKFHGGSGFRYYEPKPINDILKRTLENYNEMAKLPIRIRSASDKFGPLNNPDWFKITVNECGIYELNYSILKTAGIDIDQVDPRTIKLFNSGGGILSENLGEPIPKKREIPIFIKGEGDGSFDKSDSVTFYGFSYPYWENYVWTKNFYDDTNVYWLTWGGSNGKRMVTNSLPSTGGLTPTSFHKILHLEEDHEASSIGTLDYRDRVIWSFSEVGGAPWTNGVGLVKQVGNRDWADYNISLNATRISGSKGLMVMFRVQGPNQYYLIHMGDNSNSKLKLVKATPTWLNRNLQAVDHSIVTNEVYEINISVLGNNIKCFINGTQMIDYTDNSNPYLYGNIGLNVHYDTVIDFWNITVNGTNITYTPFSWRESFTSYPLRSNANPSWTNLQGSLGDFTVRESSGFRVYESTTENLRTTFELGSINKTKPVKLTAWVKGMSAWNEGDKKHRGSFYLNGHNILDRNWTGHSVWNINTIIPNFILKPGSNLLEFDLPGNAGDNWDYQALDWVEIHYWKDFNAYNDYLDFNHSAIYQTTGKHEFVVTNFTTSDIQGYKIFNYTYTERIKDPTITNNGSSYDYKFSDTINSGEARYVIVENDNKLTPMKIEKFVHKGLNTSDNNFDYILITHEGLYDKTDQNNPIVRLANHRSEKNGLNITVITTQEIYDEFSNGLFDPTAIRNFLQYAYNNWNTTPIYVLFAGDTSSAFRLAKNRGTYNVPTHLEDYIGAINGVLASDNWLCYVSGDDHIPDLIPGRLPFASLSEAETMISKIITYDNTPNTDGWRRSAVFHADDTQEAWEAIFKLTCTVQIDDYLLPNGYIATQEAYRDDISKSECRTKIKQGINDGCMMLQYSGHGSTNGWDSFNNNDIGGLTNKDKYPFVMSMGCSTGTFDMPTSNSFCEEIILAADKGGIASWGPSRTATAAIYQYFFHFSKNVFTNGERCIGAECFDALVNKADDYHLHIMTFFGDPAMDFGLPFEEINITPNYDLFERDELVEITGTLNPNFSGLLNITIRDGDMEIIQHNVTNVSNGLFYDQLQIPHDADYGKYRIFAFAWDGSSHRDGLKYMDIEVTKPGPDLHIANHMISILPKTLIEGRPVNITATISNIGTRPSGDFQVAFFLNDPIESKQINQLECISIERSGSKVVSIEWLPKEVYGDQEIFIVLDPDNLISELNESDNKAKNIACLLRPPSAELGNDIISYRNTTINFTGDLSYSIESEIVNYTWDFGDSTTSFGYYVNHSYSTLGSYNVSLTIKDTRNITETANQTVIIINRPPVAKFEISSEAGYITTEFYFNSTSYDLDGRIKKYFWDFGDGSNSTDDRPTHKYSEKGEHKVTLNVYDNDLKNSSISSWVTIANIGPKAVVEVSSLSVYTGVNLTFYGHQSIDPDDNNSVLNYTWSIDLVGDDYDDWDKKVINYYSENITYSFPYSGMYNVSLEVTDPYSKSDSEYIMITVFNRRPKLDFTVIPAIGTVNTKFTFSLNARDPDGYISNIFINLGDGSVINKSFKTNPSKELFQYRYQYNSNNNRTVFAYVTDNHGFKSQVYIINITLKNLRPSIDLGWDLRVRINKEITIKAKTIDNDGHIISHLWDFDGDGEFDEKTVESEVTHKYTEVGNFTLILRVVDNDGEWSDARINITVLSMNGLEEDYNPDKDEGISFAHIIVIIVVMFILLFLIIVFVKIKRKKKEDESLEDQELDGPPDEEGMDVISRTGEEATSDEEEEVRSLGKEE